MSKVQLQGIACPFCGSTHGEPIEVEESDLERYRSGALTQNAFPYLTASQRERLISGTCDTCWDKYFKGGVLDDEPQQEREKGPALPESARSDRSDAMVAEAPPPWSD